MSKRLITLVLALFVTVGIATPILSHFLPGSDGGTVYASHEDDQGDQNHQDDDD